MKPFFQILFLAIMAASCNKTGTQPKSYLALGDSYTIGERVDSTARYPVQITDSLNKLGIKMAAPEIIAVTGWTTRDLIQGIENTPTHEPYDLVSLLIGVNNQYRGMDIEIYRNEFQQLLDTAIHFADNTPEKVFVLSIPDWGVTPFAQGRDREQIAHEIDQYNVINKEITESKNVLWIDVTGISRMAELDASLVASDGLHPSGKMYAEWTKIALPELIKMLK